MYVDSVSASHVVLQIKHCTVRVVDIDESVGLFRGRLDTESHPNRATQAGVDIDIVLLKGTFAVKPDITVVRARGVVDDNLVFLIHDRGGGNVIVLGDAGGESRGSHRQTERKSHQKCQKFLHVYTLPFLSSG